MRFLFIFLFFSSLAFSQDVNKHYIDSILSIKEDKGFASFKDLLFKINRLPSELASTNFKYVDSTIKDKDTLRLYTYMYYTSTLLRYGKNDEALQLNDKGLKIAKKVKSPFFLFEYYQLRANVFIDKSVTDSALVYINKAEKIVANNASILGHRMNIVYHLHAIVEQQLGNYEKEDEYIEKIAEVVLAYPEESKAYDLSVVVYHFKTRKNYEKHAYYSQKLQEYYLKKDGISTPKSHVSISTILKMDNVPEQISELKQIINTYDNSKYSLLAPQIANDLSSLLLEEGKYKEATYYANKALEYNVEDVRPYSKLISYNNLYRIYYATKDYEKAIDALNKKLEVQNTIRKEEMFDKIANYKVKFETEQKTAQVELLQVENAYKEKQKQWYLILAFSGLIIAALLGYFAFINRKQKRILAKQKAQLEIVVEEKNVLFKEIHHRVKNSLQMVSSLLFLQSENISDNDAKNAIKDAQNRVRSLSLIHQKLYSKKHLVGVATIDYITDLTQDIFSSHQLESQNLDYDLDIEHMVLSVDTLTPIGLILNELIVNVLKHAFGQYDEDNKLTIQFYKDQNTLVLKVTDNGIGYTDTVSENSFGLKLITSLAKKLEATFKIQAKASQGTEAELIINDFEIITTK